MLDADLPGLKVAANIACNEAFRNKEAVPGAVNWADLRCTKAEFFFTDSGDTGTRVYLEEAAHDAMELHSFVERYLEAHGFPNVEIVTSW